MFQAPVPWFSHWGSLSLGQDGPGIGEEKASKQETAGIKSAVSEDPSPDHRTASGPETGEQKPWVSFQCLDDQRHLRARDYANSSKDDRVSIFKVKVAMSLCWVIKIGTIMQLALFTGPFALNKH